MNKNNINFGLLSISFGKVGILLVLGLFLSTLGASQRLEADLLTKVVAEKLQASLSVQILQQPDALVKVIVPFVGR